MRDLTLLAILLMGAAGAYGAANEVGPAMENVKITQLKRLYIETPLVARGQAACVIAVPDDAAYGPLAQKLAAAIQNAFGVAPPFRPASEVARQMPPTENLIALGVFHNNKVAEDLYLREYVQCDYNWPGGEKSYEIRTVHNPWLNGKNVVCLGSTTLEGCQAAVDRLIQVLAENAGGSIGSMIEVVKDGSKYAPPTDRWPQLPPAAVEDRIRKTKVQGDTYIMMSTCLNNYFTGGEAVWAKLFVQALRKMDELQRMQGSVVGTAPCKYIFTTFDCIEESPAFTDEERLEVTNLLYQFAARLDEAKKVQEPLTQSLGSNSATTAASFAGLYFSRSYPELELGKRLLGNIDTLYEPDMVNWRIPEDSPSYGQVTVTRCFRWALQRPDWRYVENGNLRKMTDYYMLITNNLGKQAGIGECPGVLLKDAPTPPEFCPLAGWLYKDGRYLWWWDHFVQEPTSTAPGGFWRPRGQGLMGWVPPEVLPRKRPDDLLGIAVAPLAEWIYQRREAAKYLGRSYEETHQFPIEECYDKASFRATFDPEDQYLCMSGFGYGKHSHPHANAIVNYSDKRNTMLYDDGYMIAQPSEHNTVIVLKDGMTRGIPEIAQVRAQADFQSIGLFVSRLNDYSGVDWSRCVIWRKSRYFLVVDDLQAREPANYTFQCIWRTLGKADLQGRRWVSENPPGRFNLIACSDARLTQKASMGLNLNDPPFPIDKARRLVEYVSRDMRPGESYQFANLFYSTPDAGAQQHVEAYRVGNTTTYLVEDDGNLALAGIRRSDAIPSLAIEGAAFHLLGDTLTVAGATRVEAGGPLLSSDVPVSVQANLRTGEAVVKVGKAAQVSVATAQGEKTERLEPGTHALKLRPVSVQALQGIARELQAARTRVGAPGAAAEKPRAGAGEGLRKLWDYRASGAEQQADGGGSRHPNAVRVADVNGDGLQEVFVAGTDNTVHALASDGRALWRHPLPDLIHDLIVTEDRRQILACCNDSAVYSLKPDGSLNWSVVPEAKVVWLGAPRQGQPVVVLDADINGDGDLEILVGVNNGFVYAYDQTGKLLWNAQSHAPHSMTCLAACDLDGDGRKEVIAGNTYGWTHIFSSEGKFIGAAGGTGHAGAVAVASADVDGDGKGEIAVGDRFGKVWLQKAFEEGGWDLRKETTVYETGSDVTAVAMGDVNGDGKLETAVASKNFLLYLFDAERKPMWQVNLGDVCLDIAVGDVTGDGRAEIVCGCEDGTVKVVDGGGKVVAWYQAGAAVNSVRVCELDGKPETKEIVASCEDGTVCALQMAR
ncbi:MAG: VCBS repeat-containing protein [Armatimonadetes bacterium]|nr:VCBS repeat-containing protein [Armatimonadota bacterium]